MSLLKMTDNALSFLGGRMRSKVLVFQGVSTLFLTGCGGSATFSGKGSPATRRTIMTSQTSQVDQTSADAAANSIPVEETAIRMPGVVVQPTPVATPAPTPVPTPVPAPVVDPVGEVPQCRSAAAAHVYELNGSLADSRGGPSLTPRGGSLVAGGYRFGKDQGLELIGAFANPEKYTIIVELTFDSMTGTWQKILDFKNRAVDAGLYTWHGNSSDAATLRFFPQSGLVGTVLPGTRNRYVLVRNSDGVAKTYVNQSSQFIWNDSQKQAVPDGNRLLIGIDDTQVPNENDSGMVHRIEIFNEPLCSGDVIAAN